MEKLINFIITHNLGDLASVAGLVLALVGFIVTIIGVWRSKSASLLAREAALHTKNAILLSNTISKFAQTVTTMEEIKRLHRAEAWLVLPDRYSNLRKALISIRKTTSDLSDNDKSRILGAIQQFKDMEDTVESALASGKKHPNRARLNMIVSDQIDKMTEIFEEMKRSIG